MRLQSLLWFTALWLSIMVVGCGSSPTPLPTIVAAQSAATAQPVATVAASPTETVTNTLILAPFVISLPAATPVLYPNGNEWRAQLAELAQHDPQFSSYLTTLAGIAIRDKSVAFARIPVAAEALMLVAAVAPADGLTLQAYLAAAQTALEQSRLTLGTGLVVQSATLRYDLQAAQIPLATIQYTLPVKATDTSGAVTCYQAAMLDQTGTHLLLLTFVAQSVHLPAIQAQIETILANLQDTTTDP